MTIQLIGVPFDGMGRPGGQARAPIALRAAGLPKALRHREVLVGPDVAVPIPLAERSNSGLLNEVALLGDDRGTVRGRFRGIVEPSFSPRLRCRLIRAARRGSWVARCHGSSWPRVHRRP